MSVVTAVTTTGWLRAAMIRALKTASETATAMITTGVVIWELNWANIAGVTATATVLSLLWSLRGLPEINNDITTKSTSDTQRYTFIDGVM